MNDRTQKIYAWLVRVGIAAGWGVACWCWRSGLSAVGKSEGGLDGVVGGMMVIELLAGTMRLERDRIAAGEMREWKIG